MKSRTGYFYVDAIPQAGRVTLLSGPYPNHAAAMADVDAVRKLANEIDPRSHFMPFGTCRYPEDRGPGVLQRHNLFRIGDRHETSTSSP